MKYKKSVALIILIFYFLISIGSANELPSDVRLKDKNISWSSTTEIITVFGNKAQDETIFHIHNPESKESNLNEYSINEEREIVSEIEFYIDDVKKDFTEFFVWEKNGKKSQIKLVKKISFNASINLKLIYTVTSQSNFLVVDRDNTTFKYSTDFPIPSNHLFTRFIFRVPAVNAHNLKLDIPNSYIRFPNNESIPIPISEIYENDKFLEVSYIFWNDDLVYQILIEDKIPLGALMKLKPNQTYSFNIIFSIKYETFREEWLIAIILSSIVAIVAFIGGALWGKGKGK